MVEKGGTVSDKLALFNAFCVYRTLTNKKVRYKNFLLEVLDIRSHDNSEVKF
jgi:hypothetical protein